MNARSPIPSDRELRAYYHLWLGEQTGSPTVATYPQWRRQWIADQPRHLAELRALGVDEYLRRRSNDGGGS